MKRTNIYLTEEQQRRVASKARAERVSKAKVVRRLLDSALGLSDEGGDDDAVLAASFGLWADRSAEEIEQILEWRRSDRFERLGL